jgi:hypothetical protein
MQPDTTIMPDNAPRISDQAVAGLSAEQKAAMRPQFLKAYGPQETERVFGPAPAPAPVVTQSDGPLLSPAQKASGYVALFKHATDKEAVIAQARRDGVNLQPDGKISDVPVAKESITTPPPAATAYKFDWSGMSGLPLDEIRALDADLRAGFAAADMGPAEGTAVFRAIAETLRAIPKNEDERKAFLEAERNRLEAACGGEANARTAAALHSAWFARLPTAVQEKLAGTFALHSSTAILLTAQAEERYRARKKS